MSSLGWLDFLRLELVAENPIGRLAKPEVLKGKVFGLFSC